MKKKKLKWFRSKHKLGYTVEERIRLCNLNNVDVMYFGDVVGVNTMAIDDLTGESLMYGHDVRRFLEKCINKTPTYWD